MRWAPSHSRLWLNVDAFRKVTWNAPFYPWKTVGFGPGPCGCSSKSLSVSIFPHLPASPRITGPKPSPTRSTVAEAEPEAHRWEVLPVGHRVVRVLGRAGFGRVGSPMSHRGIASVWVIGGVQNMFAEGVKRPWPWAELMGTGTLQRPRGHPPGRGRSRVAGCRTPGCEAVLALASLPFSTFTYETRTLHTHGPTQHAECAYLHTDDQRLSHTDTRATESHMRVLRAFPHMQLARGPGHRLAGAGGCVCGR